MSFFSIHYLTLIDIYNFLVILTDNILIKIVGIVYIKNNITKYLLSEELIFVWFTYTYMFFHDTAENDEVPLCGIN